MKAVEIEEVKWVSEEDDDDGNSVYWQGNRKPHVKEEICMVLESNHVLSEEM